jgi:hypothetical protein
MEIFRRPDGKPYTRLRTDMNDTSAGDARLANLSDPLFEGSLSGATRLVVVSGLIDQEHTAGSPDRHIPVTAHLIDELALADRLQSFRRRAS